MDYPSKPPVSLLRHGADDAVALLDSLADVWADAHTGNDDVAAAGFTPETLQRQITAHTQHAGFTLIVASSAGQDIGFAYGFACTPSYWFGEQLLPTITEQARGTESLAGICELAVRTRFQGRGIGTSLHAALLEALRTEWVSLLAMPGDEDAQRLYRRLGYQYAGPYAAGPDGPVLDLLLLRTQKSTISSTPTWLREHWPSELSTPRLRLRPVEARDAELLENLWTDSVVRRFLGGPVPADRLGARLAGAAGRPGHFTVVLASDEQAVGRVTLDEDHRAPGRAEVSYEFLPAYTGRGLAAEAVGAVLRWGRRTLPDHQLTAVTQAANVRSRNLLQKLGLVATEYLVEYGQDQVLYTAAPGR
ncbi:RimJ/RimL family protein N-acetyltransferase [Streptomyces sp. 1114.5]|uniref:GNAT family N-acetyltransferase n=1 Tax=unclassified Streptomyces TaxID=2593676 RepID=UPI000BD66639|nr:MULTISPECIES: GNAT family N-acetyltransferase [unclassified Streptomyces]RKT09884.1 RimJ/RimL family protein N-acetyltransferase [Streptomyces sp. 1114.5]SOB88789.1 Protein N-acetyltransferase, RimJ/RimL family [Streptomyces sp. 1331.2]